MPDLNQSYLFQYESDGDYDIVRQSREFEPSAWRPAGGRCSSYRNGRFHGRNYDWYFDRAPQFVVRTPAVRGRRAVIGVAQLMSIEAQDVGKLPDSAYSAIESALVDGMNDAGLVCNTNVCPVGDNPNYPWSEKAVYPSDITYERKYNVTTGTAPGRPRLFAGFMPRALLDSCSTVAEAVDFVDGYSWYAARNPESQFVEEFHIMVSDPYNTAVIEFVENKVVSHMWTADGRYLGCSDPSMEIGSCVKPIMTNFYLSKWDGNTANIDMALPLESRNATVTDHSQGLERYVKIEAGWDGAMEDTLRNVWYRQMYGEDALGWASEFLAGSFTFRSDRQYLVDSGFLARARAAVAREDNLDRHGYRIRNADHKTWHTVSTSIYDMDAGTLDLMVQEKDTKYRYTV